MCIYCKNHWTYPGVLTYITVWEPSSAITNTVITATQQLHTKQYCSDSCIINRQTLKFNLTNCMGQLQNSNILWKEHRYRIKN